ncbi:unnamed protein product [Cuscuta campestris]|uniref:3-dehydroquinate synthase domain-containing protein n=1 Tax=Cuscuta campestris TaxID=132261 RepID=A0A484MCY5_9ASTE|nr:unnamed protein product [Cuscuta campestris]
MSMASSCFCPPKHALSISRPNRTFLRATPHDFAPRLPSFCFIPSSCRSVSTAVTPLKVHASSTVPLMDSSPSKASSSVPTVVEVDVGNRSYPIYVGSGLLDRPELLQMHIHGKRVLIVTNTTVSALYLDKTISALTCGNPNVRVESVILPDGEQFKNIVGVL